PSPASSRRSRSRAPADGSTAWPSGSAAPAPAGSPPSPGCPGRRPPPTTTARSRSGSWSAGPTSRSEACPARSRPPGGLPLRGPAPETRKPRHRTAPGHASAENTESRLRRRLLCPLLDLTCRTPHHHLPRPLRALLHSDRQHVAVLDPQVIPDFLRDRDAAAYADADVAVVKRSEERHGASWGEKVRTATGRATRHGCFGYLILRSRRLGGKP